MDEGLIQETGVHHGRNLRLLREITGVKQDALAKALNLKQQDVSRLEQKDRIDNDLLRDIEKELGLPEGTIERFNNQVIFKIVINAIHEKPTPFESLNYGIVTHIYEFQKHLTQLVRYMNDFLNNFESMI